MPFCPRCRTEYLDGIEECADCHIRLVEQLPEEPPAAPPPQAEGEELVELLRTTDHTEAHLIRGILQTNDIPCTVFDESAAGYPGMGLVPLRLMVPAGLLADARRLVRQIESEVPPEAMPHKPRDEATCPKCGEPVRDVDHYCRRCGYKLREDG